MAALGAGVFAIADEDVPLEKAPPGVRATVKRVVGKDNLDHLDRDMENGKTVYEVDVNAKNGSFSVHMSDTGEVQGISLDIPVAVSRQMICNTSSSLSIVPAMCIAMESAASGSACPFHSASLPHSVASSAQAATPAPAPA